MTFPRGDSLGRPGWPEPARPFVFGVPTHALDLFARTSRPAPSRSPLGRQGVPWSPARRFRRPWPRACLLIHGHRAAEAGYGMTGGRATSTTRKPIDEHRRLDRREQAERAVAPGHEGEDLLAGRTRTGETPRRGEFGQIAARGGDDDARLLRRPGSAPRESYKHRQDGFLSGDLGLDGRGRPSSGSPGRKKDVIIRGGHNIFPAPHRETWPYGTRRWTRVGGPSRNPDERLGEVVCLGREACGRVRRWTAPDMLRFLDEGGGLFEVSTCPSTTPRSTAFRLTPLGQDPQTRAPWWIWRQGRLMPAARCGFTAPVR